MNVLKGLPPWGVFIILLISPVLSLSAESINIEEELDLWFSETPRAEAYLEIRPGLLSLLREAGEAGIPPGLLIAKMKEGAAKHISPVRLEAALRQELSRLRIALRVIETAGYGPTEQPLKILGILLREGVSEDFLRRVLIDAQAAGRPLADGTAACSALFQVKKITGLPEDDLLRLGQALYQSSLKASGYDAVASVFLKARINRLSDRDMLEIVLTIFEGGGGLVQLEREINRRTRR